MRLGWLPAGGVIREFMIVYNIVHLGSTLPQRADYRKKTGTKANTSETTSIISQTPLSFLPDSDSLGIGIDMPLADEGDEVVGPAEAVSDPPPVAVDAVPVPALDPDSDPEEEVGSGGAAMNISFCAPFENPYRAL